MYTIRHLTTQDARALLVSMKAEMTGNVDVLAAAVGLNVPAEYRDGVATQFGALMVQADQVLSFPLDNETEPAPLFTP